MSPDLSTRCHVRFARGYLGLDMLREAGDELDAIPSAAQSMPDVLSARVVLHLAARQWEQVIVVSRRLAEGYPEDEHAWIGWAYALREVNRIAEARVVLLEAEPHHGRTSAVLHNNLMGQSPRPTRHEQKHSSRKRGRTEARRQVPSHDSTRLASVSPPLRASAIGLLRRRVGL